MKNSQQESPVVANFRRRNSDITGDVGVPSKKKTKAALKKLVRPHWEIPTALLNDIAGLGNFNVDHVRKAAKSHSFRYRGQKFDYRKLVVHLRDRAKYSRDLILSGQHDLNVYEAGGLLEYNLIADDLERMVTTSRRKGTD